MTTYDSLRELTHIKFTYKYISVKDLLKLYMTYDDGEELSEKESVFILCHYMGFPKKSLILTQNKDAIYGQKELNALYKFSELGYKLNLTQLNTELNGLTWSNLPNHHKFLDYGVECMIVECDIKYYDILTLLNS